jgi:hypothetical protein
MLRARYHVGKSLNHASRADERYPSERRIVASGKALVPAPLGMTQFAASKNAISAAYCFASREPGAVSGNCFVATVRNDETLKWDLPKAAPRERGRRNALQSCTVARGARRVHPILERPSASGRLLALRRRRVEVVQAGTSRATSAFDRRRRAPQRFSPYHDYGNNRFVRRASRGRGLPPTRADGIRARHSRRTVRASRKPNAGECKH